MTTSNVSSSVTQRLIPGGQLFFDSRNASGVKTGERYLGLTPGFTISIKSDKIQSFSSETGIGELDDESLVKITRSGTLTIRQMSLENLALFVSGSNSIAIQSSGAVTGEAAIVLSDRHYQLGGTTANPSGVRNVTLITAAAAVPAIWVTVTPYILGDIRKKISAGTHAYQCTKAGTSGISEPAWPTTVGATVTDGTVDWICIGILAPELTTDYTVDEAMGRVYVVPTARVSAVYPMPWVFGYTKNASSREQLQTGGTVDAYGALRFIAFNAKGVNRDIYGCNVLLSPSGSIVVKEDSPKYAELTFDISFNIGANTEPALIIDGRAV
jgi:hypothetical protein